MRFVAVCDDAGRVVCVCALLLLLHLQNRSLQVPGNTSVLCVCGSTGLLGCVLGRQAATPAAIHRDETSSRPALATRDASQFPLFFTRALHHLQGITSSRPEDHQQEQTERQHEGR